MQLSTAWMAVAQVDLFRSRRYPPLSILARGARLAPGELSLAPRFSAPSLPAGRIVIFPPGPGVASSSSD